MSSSGSYVSMPELSVAIPVGSRVFLYNEDGEQLFEDVVTQHVEETALLEFKHSEIGLAEFRDRLDNANEIVIKRN